MTNLVPRGGRTDSTIDMQVVEKEVGGMANFANRRKHAFLPKRIVALVERFSIGRRKAATMAAAALAVGVGYHVVFGANGLFVYQKKRQETKQLTRETLELQRENDLLRGHVERLQSDPNAIEHQAREQLHYTRPGEVIYALPSK